MLNIAIIGTGNIAHAHARGLLEFQDRCKIIALCDIYPEKAKAFSEKYHLDDEVNIYDDHVDLLDNEENLDIVHVCTPPFSHAEIAINAMNKKVHALVEKPMATCLQECDEMLEAQRKNGVTLGIVAQNRFTNPLWKLKKVLDSQLAGSVVCAHIKSLWWRGNNYYDLWWRGLWEKEGGGPTLNHAVHHIDLLNWYFEDIPDSIVSILTNKMHDNSEVEDLSIALLKYNDGSIAEVTSSVVHHGEEQAIVLQCEHAKVSSDFDFKAEVTTENGFPSKDGNKELLAKLKDFTDSIPDLTYTGHTGEIEEFLTSIENSTEPLITGSDGRKTIEVITGIYKAGFEEKTINLPLLTSDNYYSFDGLLKNAKRFNNKVSNVENFTNEEITFGRFQ